MTCESCKAVVPSYDCVHCGDFEQGYRILCNRCFNDLMAEQAGLADFDNSQIESIRLTDVSGVEHQFQFTTRLLGDRLAIEAFEWKDGDRNGYQFQILGTPEEERFALLGKLVGKMRRALATKYLVEEPGYGLLIADRCVRGRVAFDPESESHMPMVVIDGKDVTWDAFGQMMRSFEGWQFRLDLVDRSDEA